MANNIINELSLLPSFAQRDWKIIVSSVELDGYVKSIF